MAYIFALEIIGTVAFAVAGALTAIRKDMDLLGVCILGVLSACGGGVIRDCLLGSTPPAMFLNPIYAIVATLSSIAAFISVAARSKITETLAFDRALIVTDAVGLGVFTAVGVNTVIEAGYGDAWIFAVTLGVLTGVGGGALRDVFAGETPFIFVRHIYASAAIAGAILFLATRDLLGVRTALLGSSAFTAAFRLLAAHMKWNLPKATPRLAKEKSKQKAEQEGSSEK